MDYEESIITPEEILSDELEDNPLPTDEDDKENGDINDELENELNDDIDSLVPDYEPDDYDDD